MIYFNVFGCCVSRDIVNPLISKGKGLVRQFITCNPYCLFWPSPQHKIEIDALNSYTVPNHLKRIFVKDYNKETLDYLFLRHSDYLILDIMNFRLDMLKNGDHVITFFDFLEHNREKFNKDFCLEKYKKVTPYDISENNQLASLDKLADEILKRYTPDQIIIPLFEGVEQYFNKNVIIDFAKGEIENIRKYNLLMAKLKEHFVARFRGGCHIIEFPSSVLADQQHVFGLHELHYMKLYYEYAADCIDVIVQRLPDGDEKQRLFMLKKNCSNKFELVRSRFPSEVILKKERKNGMQGRNTGGIQMNFELTASMMCADFGHLEQEIRDLEEGGIDSFHIDIMDGRYVPNYAMSLNDMRYIASVASKPLDVHLMVEHPNNTIELFIKFLRPGDTIYIHPEAEYHPSTTLQKIINAGMIPGIAINPGTSVETVMEMLRIVKKVLVMSVNPGNAGQMYLPYVGKKITKLLSLKEDMDFEIYWDGACSADKILEFAPKGVRGFVLGTTLLFGKNSPYGETLQNIRELRF